MADIQTKRVYEPAGPDDGFRVLVDRLWPRGMTKEKVQANLWLRDVSPSTELRKWYHQDRTNWEEFKRRYYSELNAHTQAVARLLEAAANGRLTLLTSSRDEATNHAVALKEYLLEKLSL